MNRFALLPLVAFCALPAAAQLPPPTETPIRGARMPALSPDGSRIAFVWRGDIYVASAAGGRATPITSHVELDAYPVFSPDGRWIAFASNRNGNFDIFVVPADGGEVRRITRSSGSEIPSDWSPDGKQVVFAGSRDTPYPGLFAIDVVTGRFTKVAEDYQRLGAAAYSPDGKRVVLTRNGFPWTRPRYTGSAASRLWTLDLASGARTLLTPGDRQHLWPRWTPDGKGIVCVTVGEETPNAQWLNRPPLKLVDSALRTPNLWLLPTTPGGVPKPLTRFVGGAVRFPSVAAKTGAVAFEHEQDLHLLAPGAAEPRRIALTAPADDKTNAVQRVTVANAEVEEAEISPDGKTFAFLVRNDLWTVPIDKPKGRNADDATRLTDWVGFDRDFNWSKDGKTLFFVSDRDGNDRVFALDVATKAVRPVWTGAAGASGPKISPDGSLVGFWVQGKPEVAGLYVAPSAGGQPRRVVAVPAAYQGDFNWSPDQRWIAYNRTSPEMETPNVFVTTADGGGASVNVTMLNAFHGTPVWSPDGKYLFFASNRDGDGLYALPLQPEEARVDELEMTFVKPAGPVRVEIDLEDTASRIRKVIPQAVDEVSVTAEGQIVFTTGGDVHVASYDGKSVQKVTQGGGVASLRVAGDGKSAFFRKGGQLFVLRGLAPGAPTAMVGFNALWSRDLRAERQAAFNQFWRSYDARFYDPNFHGRDWLAIRKRYEPLLDACGTRDEFATLLNMMVGELEASHAEVGPAAGGTPSIATRNLGLVFDYSHTGPGIKVKDVPRRSPGSFAKTRIRPGEYVVAIDDVDVALDEKLFDLLADRGERDVTLLVNGKPSRDGARSVTYKALSGGEWGALFYANRIEARRKQVERGSGGRIGYVHIAGMGDGNQTTFEREFYARAEGKDAMIIDVRENGGGNIGDRLISWLVNKPYSTYVPRDGESRVGMPAWVARAFPKKPIVVLMGESSFSNAEMFPYGMRATGLAKLVGQPTPGYVIWTTGLGLVDGTQARMPFAGVYRQDGSPLENLGEKPDYPVEWPAEDYLAGRDPQLDKALELLGKK